MATSNMSKVHWVLVPYSHFMIKVALEHYIVTFKIM